MKKYKWKFFIKFGNDRTYGFGIAYNDFLNQKSIGVLFIVFLLEIGFYQKLS